MAIAEVVDPIVLSTKIVEKHDGNCCCCCCCCDDIPESISLGLDGRLTDGEHTERELVVTIGIFSIVRIVRPAQYLVNATEYAVPDKECVVADEDNPCRIFRTMEFPTAEFCPPGYTYNNHGDRNGKCGCQG